MTAVVLDILGERQKIVILLDHIRGIVLGKDILDADHRGLIGQGIERLIIALEVVHRPGKALFILRCNKELGLIIAAIKQPDRQELADRQHLTGLFIVTEITGALTVRLQVLCNDVFIIQNGTERQERSSLFLGIIEAADLTYRIGSGYFIQTTHT